MLGSQTPIQQLLPRGENHAKSRNLAMHLLCVQLTVAKFHEYFARNFHHPESQMLSQTVLCSMVCQGPKEPRELCHMIQGFSMLLPRNIVSSGWGGVLQCWFENVMSTNKPTLSFCYMTGTQQDSGISAKWTTSCSEWDPIWQVEQVRHRVSDRYSKQCIYKKKTESFQSTVFITIGKGHSINKAKTN